MSVLSESMNWFYAGGPVMYLLLLSSIIAFAIIVERAIYYRKMSINIDAFIENINTDLQSKNLEALLAKYESLQRPLEAIVFAGLKAVKNGRCVEQAMENAAQLAAANLRKSLSVLSTLVTLSPLFGLMGTVIGMIQSFSVFSMQNGQPMAITGGVGEALIATATGLAVAVMALIGHSYFAYRLDDVITDMERVAVEVVNHLPLQEVERRDNHEAA